MIKRSLLLLLLTNTAFAADQMMPEPYASTKQVRFDHQGWYDNLPLHKECQRVDPAVVVEIGAGIGTTTCFIAQTIQKEAKIYAVDTWKESLKKHILNRDYRPRYLYPYFLSVIIQAGYTDQVIPIRMTAQEAAKALNIQADLIYFNCTHEIDSLYEDILAWAPLLSPRGTISGENWQWYNVYTRVQQAADTLGKTIHKEGNFWKLQ